MFETFKTMIRHFEQEDTLFLLVQFLVFQSLGVKVVILVSRKFVLIKFTYEGLFERI